MIPLLALIEKVVIFGLDLFIRDQAVRDERKRQFAKFLSRSARDSQRSAEMKNEYEKHRKETQWPKDMNLKN